MIKLSLKLVLDERSQIKLTSLYNGNFQILTWKQWFFASKNDHGLDHMHQFFKSILIVGSVYTKPEGTYNTSNRI